MAPVLAITWMVARIVLEKGNGSPMERLCNFATRADSERQVAATLEHGPWLNAPWGVVLMPANFGFFSNHLLIGNAGSWQIAEDTLVLVYFDSREDPSYSVHRPPGNLADGTSVCGVPGSATCDVLNTFIATSVDQAATWTAAKASSVGHQPEYEMFSGRQVPFHGDYLGIDAAAGTLFGAWTDNRDVVPGTDPRETPDGFDVLQCRAMPTSPDTCANAGGLNQNIFGAALTVP